MRECINVSALQLRGQTWRAHAQTRVEAVRLAQAHYPERLGLAVVCNPPMLFWALLAHAAPLPGRRHQVRPERSGGPSPCMHGRL